MRITSKGQVTIPQAIRERLGLLPETEVEFQVEGKAVRLKKVKGKRAQGRARAAVDDSQDPVTTKMNTDEVLALTRKM
jgi:AbrB family looped-hinge helix DNA binding protein